jgi:hypothetical protein
MEEDEPEEEFRNDTIRHKYFLRIQEKLRQKLISPYENGTFWINPPEPFFHLKKSSDPDALYYPRVFLWKPHLLTDIKLSCECCSSPLESKGYNKDPCARRIIDLDRYVILIF